MYDGDDDWSQEEKDAGSYNDKIVRGDHALMGRREDYLRTVLTRVGLIGGTNCMAAIAAQRGAGGSKVCGHHVTPEMLTRRRWVDVLACSLEKSGASG